MSKPSDTGKKTVELDASVRPSRIRRDPVRIEQAQQLARDAWWDTREWETRLVILGILFFALGISAVVFNLGELLLS